MKRPGPSAQERKDNAGGGEGAGGVAHDARSRLSLVHAADHADTGGGDTAAGGAHQRSAGQHRPKALHQSA